MRGTVRPKIWWRLFEYAFQSAVSVSKYTEGPYNRLQSKSTFVQIRCLPITVHEGLRFQRQHNGTRSPLRYCPLLAAEQDGPVKYETQVGCPYVSPCYDRFHLTYVKTTSICYCTKKVLHYLGSDRSSSVCMEHLRVVVEQQRCSAAA